VIFSYYFQTGFGLALGLSMGAAPLIWLFLRYKRKQSVNVIKALSEGRKMRA
jgi:hypothetical protein